MRFNVVSRYIGMVLLLNAVFMLLSAMISAMNDMDTGFYPLILSFLLTTVLGAFPLIFVDRSDQLNNKEGYVIVVGSWLLSCFVGTFPYLLWGGEFGFANSWFESVSGFSTTGATILNDIEALPKGLLFWRSSTHWLGGVGVVMFALVILPSLGRTKMTLSSVELSTLAKENYRYRTQKIVQILLFVYVGMTITETILLRVAGMNWFDAVNHAFSTIATGGFSTKNQSIAYYNNGWIEVIISVFMLISGLHFGLIFATITGKANNIFKSEVSRYYMISLLVGAILVSLSLWQAGIYSSLLESLRYGLFHTIAVVTTSGFATTDANLWPHFAIVITIFFMLQCACAGSTSGGIKSDRVLLAAKIIKAKIRQQQHPNAIIRIKMNNVVQDNEVISFTMLFMVAYMALMLVGTLINAAFGIDLLTGFTMSAACIGNIGPGFGEVGSMNNYGALPSAVKFSSTLFMLLGRLEIFGFIQLFVIKWWK